MGEILFLAHRVPFPPDRGDKIRSFNLLRHMAVEHRVHVAAFADDPRDEMAEPGIDGLGEIHIQRRAKSQAQAGIEAILRGKPVSLTAFANAAMARGVADILGRNPIDTIVVFSSQMAQYLPEGGEYRIIMDFVDVDSAKFQSYADQERGLMRWIMRREARLLQAFEQSVAARADASLFVSDAEANLFRGLTHADRVHAVENGIDTAFYDPDARFDVVPSTGQSLTFTGQMDYRPNVEAVIWFAREVLPSIRAQHPDVRFDIVGRNPTDAVKALHALDGVKVVGEVADVRGWLAQARVIVAPLLMARGIQNKVLEGMAMARPVVASKAAAEGIDHADTILVADTADAMAAAITRLLVDSAGAQQLGNEARQQVIQRYSWAARLQPLDALLAAPVQKRSHEGRLHA